MIEKIRSGGYRHQVDSSSALKEPIIPMVTVITALWNGAKTLEACLQSVRSQTYANVEHVIVDGGSTDGSIDILTLHNKTIAYWISEPDKGIYDALNKGIRLASGRHYIVLGCDDLLLPNAVDSLMRHAYSADVIFGQVKHNCAEDSAPLIRNHSAGTLINIEAHNRLGIYDDSYQIAADTKFLMTARRMGVTLEIDDVVGVFFVGGASGNYRRNVIEHARAMEESGMWTRWQSLVWRSPRLLLAHIRDVVR